MSSTRPRFMNQASPLALKMFLNKPDLDDPVACVEGYFSARLVARSLRVRADR